MTPTHAEARRRVIVDRLLRRKRLRRVQRLDPPRHDEGGADRNGHALNEVAAGDRTIETELALLRHRGSSLDRRLPTCRDGLPRASTSPTPPERVS